MIYHITTQERWAQAEVTGEYRTASLATDGFIHCSMDSQVARVANAGFKGVPALVVLHIDDETLTAEVRYENLEGGDELFPHVYGVIEVAAVKQVTPLQSGPDGAFEFTVG